MRNQGKLFRLFAVLLAAVLLLCACSANAVETAKRKKNTAAPAVTETPAVAEPTAEPGPLDEAQRIADYIFEHGELPDNFITKKEAQALGWDKYVNKSIMRRIVTISEETGTNTVSFIQTTAMCGSPETTTRHL